MTELFIGNVPFEAHESHLREAITSISPPIPFNIRIIKNPETHRPRGFGFVTYEGELPENELQILFSKKIELFGRRLQIRKPKTEPRYRL